jgi:hypothetical protein
MDFIKEITEARMTRTESNTRRLSYRDCCERAYLILLGLEMMRKFPQYSAEARKYARNTSRFANYDSFRASATDLYNFIYFIVGGDDAMQKLRDPEDAKDVREKTTLPQMAVNRYLSKIAQGQEPTASSEMFIKLESVLRINSSNYKRIRRTVTNLDRANSRDIREAATKLLYAARARLRSSDFIQPLEALAADKDLETSRVKDTTPVLSRPDEVVDNTDLVFLQKLVGQDKLFLAIKYIELSQQGKTIPSNVARAFDPAIEILVDIVKGGPTYVSRLLQLQKNAKRTRKRR